MNVISLSIIDLSIAALLLVALSAISVFMSLGLGRRIIFSGIRMSLQLFFIGYVLRYLFNNVNVYLICFMATTMLMIAGREVRARQTRLLRGLFGYFSGVLAMFVSSFFVTIIALTMIIRIDPWFTPQYAIPLLGMLLGNTMNGVSLASDRLISQLYDKKNIIEQRLALGQTWQESSSEIRRDSMRTGMIPIINSMAAAGLVSLPGMMTGQILGGSSPIDAVKYQVLIILLIATGTGLGVIVSIWIISKFLFDDRHRLCLEKIIKK